MTFSIIIPVYNTARYLPQCLDSILSQSFVDFEVICVNDGSIDESLEVLQAYANGDERLKVVSIPNSGVSYARNVALDLAQGDYVLFVDSDDWLVDDALDKLSQWVCLGKYDIVSFNTIKYFENDLSIKEGELIPEEFTNGWTYYEQCSLQTSVIPFGAICGRAYSISMLNEAKIRFDEELQYNEDVLFTIVACFHAGAVKVIDDSLYMYRIRKSGSLMTTPSNRRFEDMITFANKLSNFFISHEHVNKRIVYRTAASFYRNGLLWCLPSQRKSLRKRIRWTLFRKVSKVGKSTFCAYIALRYMPWLAIPLINNKKRI